MTGEISRVVHTGWIRSNADACLDIGSEVRHVFETTKNQGGYEKTANAGSGSLVKVWKMRTPRWSQCR